MAKLKNGQNIIFWQKVVVGKGFPTREGFEEWDNTIERNRVLIPCKAVFVRESDPLCGTCREPEVGHDERPRRAHKFDPTYLGLTMNVMHVDAEESFTQTNVQQGYLANCWTLTDSRESTDE